MWDLRDVAMGSELLLGDTDFERTKDEGLDIFEKIHRCSILYDFKNSKTDIQRKQQKRRTLHKLVVELAAERELPEEGYKKLIEMIGLNLFREAPAKGQYEDPENNLTLTEPAWEHFKWVYELLLVLLTSKHFHMTLAKNSIDRNFILQLLNLLDSGDARERRYLLRIIYQIYKNFVAYRPVIRVETVNTVSKFLYETESLNGIAEVVELLGIIIHGLSVPVKEKHKVILRVLLPLHRMEPLHLYHSHLTYCVLEMIRKNETLVQYFIEGILSIWPKTNGTNQVMFLTELQAILSLATYDQFEKVQRPLFEQIAQSSSSLHYNVAETALKIWEDKHVQALVEKNTDVVMPILFPELCKIIEEHWSKKIVGDAMNVLQKFRKMNRSLLHGLIRTFSFEERRKQKRKEVEEEMFRRFASLDNVLIRLCS